ncbi:hypothetical protein P168DRAFT_320308 [Aspergillus campestris IBT 28561]|uniref:Uncharacterized protein n=1 Tax=Aspergillus campestris (strain IBT 28561) TaxID=1392248 RepID=A0A2I1CYR1_ASPC2|nr:uncharacterized protein P168DRAFT_320308 [Aspergillus campestris IBT 28561]PKY02763.1 hypothetical protein P168DRAFT_320308 [Aspergillus campestris IBT 28561]
MAIGKTYIFDSTKLAIPIHLRTVITGEPAAAFNHCRHVASRAFRMLKRIEQCYAHRYTVMCSTTDRKKYRDHGTSMDRIMFWKEDHKPRNPTLAPSAKIPAEILALYPDRRVYEEFVRRYNRTFADFIRGPYCLWRESVRAVDRAVARSGLSEMDQQEWKRWWQKAFLGEMSKWEDDVYRLVLPKWEVIVGEVCRAIRRRVEYPGALLEEFWAAAWRPLEEDRVRYGSFV